MKAPFRRIVEQDASRDSHGRIWHMEILDCGHTVHDPRRRARVGRRCVDCRAGLPGDLMEELRLLEAERIESYVDKLRVDARRGEPVDEDEIAHLEVEAAELRAPVGPRIPRSVTDLAAWRSGLAEQGVPARGAGR